MTKLTYDLDLYVTLTVKVKLLNSTKIAIILLLMDRFDLYFVKSALLIKPTF